MNFDEYVVARRTRLIEHAVDLGCPESLAAEHVDRVLTEHRRLIQKAADPDPLVHEALAQAMTGEPTRRGPTRPLLVAGLVAAAVAVGVALTYEAPTKPMPSLFGYDGEAATAMLEERGFVVDLTPLPACDPLGQVLGSWPRTGERVEAGTRVIVYTAVPAGFFCAARYLDRHDAWEFLEFALGGPAPKLTDNVLVVVDGSPTRVTSAEARAQRWGHALQTITEVARETARTGTRLPRLLVTSGRPPRTTCGVARPALVGRRTALRLQIDPRQYGDDSGCPLTIDLYRVDRVIDTVVVYTAE